MPDWPHDPDSEEGSEVMRKYGHAILAKKIDEDDLPITKAEYAERFGDHPIRIDHETVVSVNDVLEHVEREEFETFPEFHRVTGRAMRRAGYWTFDLGTAADRG
jgi:hypothetical protein